MLGRRQIREKVVETLYSYYQNPIKFDVLQKNMFSEINKIYHLYIYELNFLVGLKRIAEDQIEIGKNKFIKTAENENPNQKFVRNQILIQLEDNEERRSFSEKHKELNWDPNDELLVKTFQRIKAGKRYQDYMTDEEISFEDDQKFLGKLFLRYVAENTDLHDRFEEKEMSWADDFHIANSMIQKTIGFMKESEPSHTLIKMLKDDEDEDFARKLLSNSLNNWEDTEKKLESKLLNWDLERISLMDRIILVAAITELDSFPLTASRIIINEYIDVSKVYGTEKSHIFINGILDKYTKDLDRV
ncbi:MULTISPECIES: transcription antitermination protein NusB [Epilithonimonas]|jgi:N utilization substance protein B|uniref:NusB antitermination factor n=2 Tax=Epilithonimonas TaxID=2782229 RepID=A0A1H6M6U8_9FLAO|nr:MULTISPECIES: transcription antitermination protein NusB [Epilithonimonas]MBP7500931.1 transcription antitermination protein NusB [Chryseobacterium sp.]AZI56077.1 transcription antitermination protein NusB [Epilithonimonas vandammei]ROI12684.1 transcription antitermination protein NusB [Epilithonimonas hominis]SEH94634.1 NusB antitermination factor [Epilithonimonas hominis]HAP95282.1 transcription antitermination protein NusB [Chryseobacterium sp.]